eukprot:131739-Ditylum_brightwellii.AAC.1
MHIIGNEYLLPFVTIKTFREEGPEVLDWLFLDQEGLTSNTTMEMLSEFNLLKIAKDELLDNLTLCLHMYVMKLNAMYIHITDSSVN